MAQKPETGLRYGRSQMELFFNILNADFFSATIRLATPLLFATLGGILNERAGVINIGLEGVMLIGALAGVFGAWFLNSPWLGFACGMIAGGMISWVHGFVSISLRGNQIVSGAAINLIGIGLTSFLIRIVFGLKEQQRVVPHFDTFSIPGLADIPLIGPVLVPATVSCLRGSIISPRYVVHFIPYTLGAYDYLSRGTSACSG